MNVQNDALISQYLRWLTSQFNILIDVVKHATKYKLDKLDMPIYTYPNGNLDLYAKDIESTSNFLTTKYHKDYTQCGMLSIIDILDEKKFNIDYFFVRMHLLAHHLIKDNYKHLDILNDEDFILIESIAIFFALILCKHFYQLESPTTYMAGEIVNSFIGSTILENKYGTTYTSQDKLDLCVKLVDAFLANKSLLSN